MNKKQEELKFWNIFLNKLHRAMAILSEGLMLFILIDTNIRLTVGFGCMCLIVGFILSLYYASKDYAGARAIRIKRNGKYTDVPIEHRLIGTKPQIKKWLKTFDLDFDEIIKKVI